MNRRLFERFHLEWAWMILPVFVQIRHIDINDFFSLMLFNVIHYSNGIIVGRVNLFENVPGVWCLNNNVTIFENIGFIGFCKNIPLCVDIVVISEYCVRFIREDEKRCPEKSRTFLLFFLWFRTLLHVFHTINTSFVYHDKRGIIIMLR